ncbi:uncharacterized protein LOC108088097 [Drosophila ficusphila]|uniref:uncharacterized protein LOC108088097 n=1 Tax=Drosophila ficusphila TaxID=30025 RepID=UPI0007E66A81|nr:uncharacterized protein LOC108088097 [Drosophila ficusphila]
MNRLVAILGFCLLLIAGHSAEEPQETQSQEWLDTTTPLVDEGFPSGSHELPELPEPIVDGELVEAQKINWLPVWEEQEHPRFARAVDEVPSVPTLTGGSSTPKDTVEDVLVPKDNKDCPNDADRGLTNLIRVARPLLPAARLRNILANAAEDSQVRDLIKLLRSDGLKAQVQRLRATKQHQVLHDFLCRRLKLDPAYYVDFARLFLDVHVSEPPTSKLPNRRPGIRGLLLDLRDAVPRATLRDMYLRLYSSDSELAAAVRLIRGSEFRRLLRDLRSLKEFRTLADELEKAGVPLRQVQQLVTNALGWSTVDLGAETLIWSV